ncbi:hypothetical protein CALCODRAFT_504657 [Calocera cornea HHB12733]|uniref:Uncharacterized protein n=1 Tax=Calocera cornea HHB12733 TaxID=1353952 RepID=A0A165CAG6_9BASI|nr:hypothetical protein CALCODRAFT_504657 [Calocera cornea HHB12733]
MSRSETAYSDKFVSVDPLARTLTVHHYRVTTPSLVIPLAQITYLLPAAEATRRLGMKAWGVGLTGVCWARDWARLDLVHRQREFDKCFVVKCEGNVLRTGFTVEDRQAFLGAMEQLEPGVTGRRPGQKEIEEMGQASYEQGKKLSIVD